MCLQYKSFENTLRKGEIARNEQFLPFLQCFPPIWRSFCLFLHIWNCHLQTVSVWNILKFVVWERVNSGYLLNSTTQSWLLMTLKKKPFENTVGKGEIACNKQFLLFPQCLLPIWITFCHFRQIWNCRLQTLSVWKSLKFVVCKWVKLFTQWQNFGLDQMESIADDKINVIQNSILFWEG